MKIGLLHSTIRAEEKLLMQAAQRRSIQLELVDIRSMMFSPNNDDLKQFDIFLERSVSTVKGNYAISYIEYLGIPVINSSAIANICEDKFLTSLLLEKQSVPQVPFRMVFSEQQAKLAVKELGCYPVVMKPALGSWGRLIAKVESNSTLEAMIEHREMLGGPQQKAYFFQQYVNKKYNRDIRTFVIGGETICAIYRQSDHWITNTARGAQASNCQVDKDLAALCKKASDVVGGGILAMDIFETDNGYIINEINHTMEFRNSEKPTGVSISDAVIEYCVQVIQKKQ